MLPLKVNEVVQYYLLVLWVDERNVIVSTTHFLSDSQPTSAHLYVCVCVCVWLQGSICEDAVCVVCCPCCSAVQMGQELKYHRLA